MANNNRKTMSYFDTNIQKGGENFLLNKSVQEIQKDARKRIFKDMVFGNVDYSKHGKYFMDARFLELLINASEEELQKHYLLFNAISMFDLANPGTNRVPQLVRSESELFTTFNWINYYLKMVRDTGFNISYLPEMSLKISQFKNEFGNNY